MSISAITIQNFKGIRDQVRIELKPITLLFGANSAGKSTVLQALLYVRELLERRNTDPDRTIQGGTAIDLGGFRTMVHNHDLELPIVLRFDLDFVGVDLVDFSGAPESQLLDQLSLNADSAWIQMAVKWSERLDKPVHADYEVGINCIPFARIETNPDDAASHSVEINSRHPWLGPGDEGDYGASAPEDNSGVDVAETSVTDALWQLVTAADLSAIRSPGRTESLFDEINYVLEAHEFEGLAEVVAFGLTAPGEYLLSILEKLRYLGPIREIPERNYTPALSPDEGRWANGLAAWDWLMKVQPEQLADLNAWLTREDRLGTGYRIEVKRFKEFDTEGMLYLEVMQGADMLDNYDAIRKGLAALPVKTRVLLRQDRDFLEVAPQDVGIGISQLVPVVVAALDPHDGITVIEQPELHIHPAIQVSLGDLFISQTRGDAGAMRQFLLETHSEHLMLRLLRRIREHRENKAPNDFDLDLANVAVYYVQATAHGTAIKRLHVDTEGEFIDRWPAGFFEERGKELF
jgi:hypothetical protein